ncbi:MAG: TRAP transporter small permease subunit [Hyphomicrobiaceae bacterium]|nr:TRAP transporter small permease subunit [Hyphomicrobiaceae bacterium]
MAKKARAARGASVATAPAQDSSVILSRCFAWSVIAIMVAFLLNNYLTNWRDWPGPTTLFLDATNVALASIQAGIYAVAVAAAIAYVLSTKPRELRPDSELIFSITAYIIRASFWTVFFVGLADMVVSFLRVEGLLPVIFGDKLAVDLGKSTFRGVWVHFPMLALGVLVATYHRGLGFPWLALLVVSAELLIVLTRFIFSYEQAFMADLVRFWYAALFLFASAYTLLEEGHVRVDVLYSTFTGRTKGLVNAWGSVLLGMSLCAVIIFYGMDGKSTVINGPLLIFETTQTGFGMYVKYWMAGFLGIFAITMMLQFSGYFLEGVADYRDDPGKRKLESEGILEH